MSYTDTYLSSSLFLSTCDKVAVSTNKSGGVVCLSFHKVLFSHCFATFSGPICCESCGVGYWLMWLSLFTCRSSSSLHLRL